MPGTDCTCLRIPGMKQPTSVHYEVEEKTRKYEGCGSLTTVLFHPFGEKVSKKSHEYSINHKKQPGPLG